MGMMERIRPADGVGQARMEESEEGMGGCRIQRKGRWREDGNRLGWRGEEEGTERGGLGCVGRGRGQEGNVGQIGIHAVG